MLKTRVFGAFWIYCSVVAFLGLALVCALPAAAQQKHKLTSKISEEQTKYILQHSIDVGDIPGHKIRVAELHRVFPTDKPVKFDGVSVVDEYDRFFSDYVNFCGRHWGYGVYNMENGDKIYFNFDGNTHTTVFPDGGTKGTYSGTSTFTGGIGKFKGIRGTAKYTGAWDPSKGLNENSSEIEYWIE